MNQHYCQYVQIHTIVSHFGKITILNVKTIMELFSLKTLRDINNQSHGTILVLYIA